MKKLTLTLLLLLISTAASAEVYKSYHLKKGDKITTSNNGHNQYKKVTKVRSNSRRTKVKAYNYTTRKYEQTTIRH